MIPRSRDDLAKRGKALRLVAEHSVGLMGRTPDYMNVTFGPLHALRAMLPLWFPRVNEILRLIGSHNVFATPTRRKWPTRTCGR
jgi:aromatic ring hydroxylase